MPAQPFRKRHAQDRPRLPVGRRARRRRVFDAADRQPEILHPRREYIAQHAPGFLDVEFGSLCSLLHER